MSDTSLITFKAISNFTNALNEIFGKEQRSLALYNRLINKTTIAHEKAINKHIVSFRDFSLKNREAFKNKDLNSFTTYTISYSSKVFIDLKPLFASSDKETQQAIWNHILTIAALVDPAGKAKELLKENLESQGHTGNEPEFLSNIVEKVEEHVNPDANPMEAIGAIMNSGIFNELIGGMQSGISNGELDLSKLMGAVQGMVTSLGQQTGGDPEAQQTMNMVNSMMGNMTTMMNNPNMTNPNMSSPNSEPKESTPDIREIDE